MNRDNLTAFLCAGLIAMLPLQAAWALSIDAINIDTTGSLNFTLTNDDVRQYNGIIIETPFTSIDQFQLGGFMPAAWTQSYSLTSGNVISIYVAPTGTGMDIGQTRTFSVAFDTTRIPSIAEFMTSNPGTFTITAFTDIGNFGQSYSLGSYTVPLPTSLSLLIGSLGLLATIAAKRRYLHEIKGFERALK